MEKNHLIKTEDGTMKAKGGIMAEMMLMIEKMKAMMTSKGIEPEEMKAIIEKMMGKAGM